MTGEIASARQGAAVGGLKEESGRQACRQNHRRRKIAPKRNARDVEDFSEGLRKAISSSTLDTMDEKFSPALRPATPTQRAQQEPRGHLCGGRQPMVPVAPVSLHLSSGRLSESRRLKVRDASR